jgi:hypothetical protein
MWYPDVEFEILKGKTIREIKNTGDELVFLTEDGEEYKQHHYQSCCEDVRIEDICGDLGDLIGSPILLAEEVISSDAHPEDIARKIEGEAKDDWRYSPESFTWSFYKLATIKGSVTIRWYGTSNGYYGERVSLVKVTDEQD